MAARDLALDPSNPLLLFKYFGDHVDDVTSALWSHAWLSVLPVVIGLVVSLPLGYLGRRYRWLYPPLISITGLLYTIPSIALFVVMPALLGTQVLSPINVVVALTIYTVALLVRVVADGLDSVPDDVAQAATAMGYTRFQRLVRVELPIAVPVITAGLRVAMVSNVSIVSVAGTIGIANLGQLFITGFQLSLGSPYYPPIALGILLSVLLALVLDALILLADRAATPWRRAVAAR
ncbi:ABC transporter permease [Jatrophihabitans sp. YIM 134969]